MRENKLAGKEKERLEVNQRTRRKERTTNEKTFYPMWFEEYEDADSEEVSWAYKGGYWETRHIYKQNNFRSTV